MLGAFVETLHNASLIIDDIEDNSVMRRGEDCCHVKFGLPVAINAGTTAYFLAMNYILRITDEVKRARLLEVAVKEMTNLHLGQNQDIVWNRDLLGDAHCYTEAGYLTLCKHKTAGLMRIVVAFCCILSRADVSASSCLEFDELYNGIGVLFQVVDDILNLEETTVASNKSARGEDIREGNKTIITIHALQNAHPEKRARLKEILLMKTSDHEVIEEAIHICEEAGSIKYAKHVAQKMAADLADLCRRAVTHPGVRSLTCQLIGMILERKN